MKTKLIAILAGALVSGCTQDNAAPNAGGALAAMLNTRTLDVCYAVYPPTVIKDQQTGELSGHLIDTLEAILKEADISPRYTETSWGTAAAALASGRCSVVVAGYYVKIPRALSVSFTDPLFYAGDGALVRKGDTRFKEIADADREEVTVAVVNGESGHEYAKTYLPHAKLRVISIEGGDLSRVFLEVTSKRADIAITDVLSAKRFADQNQGSEALFTDRPFNMNPVSWAVRHEDQPLLNFLNSALEVLRINGKLLEFQNRYQARWMQEARKFEIR